MAPLAMRWARFGAGGLSVAVLATAGVLLARPAAPAPVQHRVRFLTEGSTATSATIDGREVDADGETVVTNWRVIVLTVLADDEVGQCGISVDGRLVVNERVYAPWPTTCLTLS